MVNVAVAGGTGGIGKAIVEELVLQGKHSVIILSRNSSSISIANTSVPVIAADYTNKSALQTLLVEKNVEVVISALMLASEEGAQAQLNLINAAIKSGTVKSFIPSEYGIHYTEEVAAFHPAAKWWLDASSLLRSSHLQYTLITIGWLLDSHGIPHYKSHMKPFKYVLDFDNRRAVLPGDGTNPVSVLHSTDIAKYIAAMLEQSKWPELSPLASDRMSWGEMVKVAERVMGEKWDISYDSVESLKQGQATLFEQPEGTYSGFTEEGLRHMVSEFGMMVVTGRMDVTTEGTRNAEFPQVEPITVEEIIEKAWGRKKTDG
ncbi:hypothetical protein B0J11DRAFT_58997 [Dendryphion nanum]|uniref:NmrA-like domain-containing protein n=1 Tax=Dendryphion nanum TaxID=256645 RepID=A0A9P9DLM8_9PLEO|nr:hypothetical protein B0J11DRAFT_58997 [Dendryphion nanum]